MTRTSKAAYLSSFLDADGFIGIDDGVIHLLRHCVRTGNTTRKVCKYLQKHFGGNFHRVPTNDESRVYYWKLYGSVAIPALLAELLPFLKARHQDALEVLNQLHVSFEDKEHEPNRREVAAYQAGYIDAKGFEGDRVPFEQPDLEKFFLSILPYLVERKPQVNALLQLFRSTSTTITPERNEQ